MPTLFEQLDGALAATDVSVSVSVQADGLGEISGTLSGLMASPPGAVGDLATLLAELPGPDLAAGADLAATLTELGATLPSDLTGVVGEVVELLARFDTSVSEVAGVLMGVLDAVVALRSMTAIDFRCIEPPESSDGGGGGAGGGGAGGGGAGGGGAGGGPGGGSATATATASARSQLNAVLDQLPDPLTVVSFLRFVNALLDIPERDTLFPYVLPFVDDIRDPLATLVAWDDMSGEEIRADFAATLGGARVLAEAAVAETIADLGSEAAEAAGALPLEQLAQVADGLAARLEELGDAVRAGDLGGTGPAVGAVNAFLDQYETLRENVAGEPLARVDDSRARLAALPSDLQDRVTLVVSAVAGTSGPGLLGDLADVLAAESADTPIAGLQEDLSAYIAWLQDLLAKLDLSALEGPLGEAAAGTRKLVDDLDEALVGVTIQVQELFAGVESIVAGLDLDAVRADVESALEDFRDTLVGELTELFATARDAVHGVVEAIDGAVDMFDPAEVVGALQDAIDAIAGVLEDPGALGAVEGVRTSIEGATTELEALSFQPLVDQIVAAIDEVTEALGLIDTAALGVPAQLALQAALALLPEDLTPVTDPIVVDFGVVVETGPVPLLASVEAQPARLLDHVYRLEPSTLVGSAISTPYHALLARMESFKPSALLAPVADELDALKARLRAEARPGLALEPLETRYGDLLDAFDRLRPEDLVAPLSEPVAAAAAAIVEALPVDETFAQLDAVLASVEDAAGLLNGLAEPLERLRDLLEAFTDPVGELEDWIDSILGKVEPLPDDGTLAPALAALVEALDRLRAANLAAALASAVDPVLASLAELDPLARFAAVVRGHRSVRRDELEALLDSPAKTALATVLDRFDPLDPGFGAPYRSLAAWQTALETAKTDLASALVGWDERYHAAGRPLAGFDGVGAAPAQLAARVREHLEGRFVRPLRALFGVLTPLHDGLDAVLGPVAMLRADLDGKLDALLTGPDSLTGIRDEIQALADRVRTLDLDVLSESLAGVFAELRTQLAAADPAAFREVVDEAFEEMLGTFELDSILPAADVEALDASYEAVVAKLEALDPEVLVTQVVQPAFEATVVPLLAAFDLTPLVQALIARLRALDDELRAELARVNEAWQRLRGAIPSIEILPIDIDIDVDIDVDVGAPF